MTDHERIVLLAMIVGELTQLLNDCLAGTKAGTPAAAAALKGHQELLTTNFPELAQHAAMKEATAPKAADPKAHK